MLLTIIHDPRLLHERFLKACRSATGPVVVVSDVTLLMNSPAAALIRADDRSLLWEWARKEVASGVRGTPGPRAVSLVSGARPRLCEGIWMGSALVGAIVRLTVPASAQPPRSLPRAEGRRVEWAELTDSQRMVAEHVAHGLTNRQTADLLSVSRHTVDYHLRHIFRKLQIHSRVELARLVAEVAAGKGRLRV
ncbi:helix-turn-helix transcriptional regulator [Streptomyces sp. SID12488]|uniref:helix-turn-helix transcriptional regulator n=1 Tax=Streptomyces sp. SID12488 TaxID=2706040 RepID=UPI0013DC4E6A|nr:helix-turn-helix transcriptional regulator [Streptomyces sp. SID12488]NEA68862.1 helix-turn-helix transcriptional regulator [Streptomyces sp. SID12488]